jgi:hypothetical protein
MDHIILEDSKEGRCMEKVDTLGPRLEIGL